MKKKLLALAMTSVMVIGAGCSSRKTNAPTTTLAQMETKAKSKTRTNAPRETEGSMEPVTVEVTNYALLGQGCEAFWNGVKAGLGAENPNITIEWVTTPYGGIINQVINMTGGGDRVDMVLGEIGQVPGPTDAGPIVSVTDVLPADYLADFYPTILDSLNIDGQPYKLPMYVSPYVLYYNTELFEQVDLDPTAPPTTYDEMLEYAEKLSKLKDSNGNPVYAFGQATTSIPVSGSSASGMIFNFGGTLLASDDTLSVNNQGFKDVITMLKTLDKKGYNPQGAKLKNLRNLLTLGQLAMYYGQSWGFNGIQSISPDARNFTASAKPLLGGAGKEQSILQTRCLVYTDNGDTRREACGKLTRYPVTSEVLDDYPANITSTYPTREDMEDSEDMNPVLTGTTDSAENVTAQVFVSQINNLNLELCILAQSVTISDKDVDAVIVDFKRAAEAILEQQKSRRRFGNEDMEVFLWNVAER